MEAFEYVPDGTVKFTFPVEGKDTKYVLRRPKVGEFRKIWESVLALADEREQLTKEEKPINQEQSLLAHLRMVVGMLCETPLPEDDEELPLWFTNGNLPVDMAIHWRTLPLAPGQTAPGTRTPS